MVLVSAQLPLSERGPSSVCPRAPAVPRRSVEGVALADPYMGCMVLSSAVGLW